MKIFWITKAVVLCVLFVALLPVMIILSTIISIVLEIGCDYCE